MRTRAVAKDRAIQSIGGFARADFLGDVRDGFQNAGGLVNVIADVLKLCRAAEDKERLHACFDGAANVGLHGVANHHALIERTLSGFGEFAARLVEHIAVGFAEMKARAGPCWLRESGECARARSRLVAGDRAPVVRVGSEQSRAAFDALVRFGEFFRGRSAFAHDDVARVNPVACDAMFVQRGEQSTFTDDKHSAGGMRFAQEIRRVQRGRVEMARGQYGIPRCFSRTARSSGVGAELFVRKRKGVPVVVSASTKSIAPSIR